MKLVGGREGPSKQRSSNSKAVSSKSLLPRSHEINKAVLAENWWCSCQQQGSWHCRSSGWIWPRWSSYCHWVGKRCQYRFGSWNCLFSIQTCRSTTPSIWRDWQLYPRQVGIVPILSSYIAHRRDIIVARSRFDKEKAERRLHYQRAWSASFPFFDEVIASDPKSDNKQMPKKTSRSLRFHGRTSRSYRHLAIVPLDQYRYRHLGRRACQSQGANRDLGSHHCDERTMFNFMKKELREVKSSLNPGA